MKHAQNSIECARCGYRVVLTEVYAVIVIVHQETGQHQVIFTPESAWIPEYGE